MIKRWVIMVLALMIALQSLTAVADAHLSHQSGISQLELSKPHQYSDAGIENQISKQAPDTSGQSLYECPHCCHCPVHGVVMLVGSSAPFAIFPGIGADDYRAALTSVIPSSLFRPPIA